MRAAQERFHAREGTYGDEMSDLDISIPSPKYFTVGDIAAGSTDDLEDSWQLTLTRVGASAGYGAYTVTFTEQGYDSENSTITARFQTPICCRSVVYAANAASTWASDSACRPVAPP